MRESSRKNKKNREILNSINQQSISQISTDLFFQRENPCCNFVQYLFVRKNKKKKVRRSFCPQIRLGARSRLARLLATNSPFLTRKIQTRAQLVRQEREERSARHCRKIGLVTWLDCPPKNEINLERCLFYCFDWL